MDDLTEQLGKILSDPQSMQQIQSMAAALGMGGNSQASAPAPPSQPPEVLAPAAGAGQAQSPALPAGGLASLLGSAANPAPSPAGLPVNALELAGRVAPLLSQVNRDDDHTRLLKALRPLLSEARRNKLDEALRILQIMRLLPLFRQMGGF